MGFFDSSKSESFSRQRTYGFPEFEGAKKFREQFAETTGPVFGAAGGFGPAFDVLREQGTQLARGEFGAESPEGRRFIGAAVRPAERFYSEKGIPDLLSFAARGRNVGSSRSGDLFRQATRDFGESLGDISTRALGEFAGRRTAGYQAGAAGVESAWRNILATAGAQFGMFPQAQVVSETGTGTSTASPSGFDIFQQASMLALLGYGGYKTFGTPS